MTIHWFCIKHANRNINLQLASLLEKKKTFKYQITLTDLTEQNIAKPNRSATLKFSVLFFVVRRHWSLPAGRTNLAAFHRALTLLSISRLRLSPYQPDDDAKAYLIIS